MGPWGYTQYITIAPTLFINHVIVLHSVQNKAAFIFPSYPIPILLSAVKPVTNLFALIEQEKTINLIQYKVFLFYYSNIQKPVRNQNALYEVMPKQDSFWLVAMG